MADIVFPEAQVFNPNAWNEAAAEARKAKSKPQERIERKKKKSFIEHFEKNEEVEKPASLPYSKESTAALLASVQEAAESLARRPLPDEIVAYKKAVRDFINYVVENSIERETVLGGRLMRQPGKVFSDAGKKPSEEKVRARHTILATIDAKLEQAARDIMLGQKSQIEILARTGEIQGLLVDLTLTGFDYER
jgi:uncharacterized protein YaaR (DUF327 family)